MKLSKHYSQSYSFFFSTKLLVTVLTKVTLNGILKFQNWKFLKKKEIFNTCDLTRVKISKRYSSYSYDPFFWPNFFRMFPVTVFNTNGKSHMGSPTAPSHLTLSDLKRSRSRSLRFWSIISPTGAELGHMLLLKEAYILIYMGYFFRNWKSMRFNIWYIVCRFVFLSGKI